ncbi:MAG: asparagine synthase (glutamine-hydrolyzing) [Chitinophagaceae bacterium]|nr:asparagine synthase (glutamine-hydrolyzing) [Chitinophagaceae bacterium]
MRDSMWRGGPDDSGDYYDDTVPLALGVRRLALLDLSAAGHQPMQGRRAILAFNGEIYNFDSIRQQLLQAGCTFTGHSDTEVVLQAYEQWGTDCFQQFNGMFALAIWDRQRQQLILARDHAGMKPLYYFLDPAAQQCYFASEIRALRTLRPDWPEDPHWRIRLLAYGFIPEPGTMLQHVQCLPAGHVLTISLPQFSTHLQPWYQPATDVRYTNAETANQALRQALTSAVDRHQVADAPLGVFLSGGIDSSIIALAAAATRRQPIATVSLYFDDAQLSEQAYQEMMVAKLGSQHHSFRVTQQQFEEELPSILQALDQPGNDGINSYFICKYARQVGLKAVLSGLGADELMGGYPSFRRQRWVKPLQTLGPLLGASRLFVHDTLKRLAYLQYPSADAQYLFHRGYFSIGQIAALTGYSQRQVTDVLQLQQRSSQAASGSMLQQVSQMEQRQYMQNQLLRDTDVMSMWHSVEVRLPFLDREVLQVARQTADEIRFARHPAKKWLIDSFADQLPAAIWRRSKMGFVFPFTRWMRQCHLAGACHPLYFHIRQRFLAGRYQWSRYWAYLLSTGEPIVTKAPGQRILFASLRTFSAMGGIEKFNRSFAKALCENARELSWQVTHLSAYDEHTDERYYPAAAFVGFGKKRARFLWYFLRQQRHYQVHMLGHVNLAPLFTLLRWRQPRRIQLVHGIEVWQPLHGARRRALHMASEVWSVSQYTASRLRQAHPHFAAPVHLFPNTLDPYFRTGSSAAHWKEPPGYLLTISRLQSTEQYKGYDSVIRLLPALIKHYPQLRYVIGGSGEAAELQRIQQLITRHGLEQHVLLAGFIPDDELPACYANASVFVMPSRKEGFGIVFLEAAACGVRIIAGNADGSPEALLQGRLGTLVDPDNLEALQSAIEAVLALPALSTADRQRQQALVQEHFGFQRFKQHQAQLLQPGSRAKQLAASL